MQILENVKHSLYKILVFIGIGYVLSSCIGGGDSYTSMVCDSDACDYQYGFKVSNDRRSVRAFSTNLYSDWIDLMQGGTGIINGYTYFEIKNHMIRVKFGDVGSWGDWVDLCGSGTSESYNNNYYNTYGIKFGIKVEVNNGKARYCYIAYGTPTCGNWVAFDKSYVCGASCPSGYTYNSSRKICEADPVISYTCPYGGGTCVEQSKGIAYCSPYNCNSTNVGVWCATGNINTSNMNANSIGMWQCSKDGSWYVDEASCKTGCNYFQCSYNNNWYQGDKSVCELNCREQGQCTEVNQ